MQVIDDHRPVEEVWEEQQVAHLPRLRLMEVLAGAGYTPVTYRRLVWKGKILHNYYPPADREQALEWELSAVG